MVLPVIVALVKTDCVDHFGLVDRPVHFDGFVEKEADGLFGEEMDAGLGGADEFAVVTARRDAKI